MLNEEQQRVISGVKAQLELMVPRVVEVYNQVSADPTMDADVINDVESLKDCLEGSLSQTGNLVE